MERITAEYVLELNSLRASVKEIQESFARLKEKQEQAAKSGSNGFKANAKAIDDLRNNLRALEAARDRSLNPAAVARFNDKIAETNNRIKALVSSTDKVKELPKSISLADKASGALNSTMGKLAGAVAGAFALERILAFGAEAVQTALKVEGIELAYNKLNRPDLLDKLRAATKGTVDDMTLMQNAVKANNFKIPLDALANMFAFAEQRARDTGESVDMLVESAVLGISRQSIMIIDNLGISATAVQQEMEKTGDFATAVSNIMQQELAKQGNAIETAGQKVDRYAAQWSNFKAGFGKMIIDMGVWLAEGLESFDTGLKGFFNLLSGGDGKGNGGKLFANIKENTGWIKTAYKEVQAAAAAGNQYAQAELERRQKIAEITNTTSKVKADTLEGLEAELKTLQDQFKVQQIGSDNFLKTKKEIERVQNRIDTVTGKNAEKLAKDLEKARIEKERLNRIAGGSMAKTDMGLNRVDNSENILEAEKRLNEQVLDESKRLGDALELYWDEKREEKKKKDKEAADYEKQLRQETVAKAMELGNALFELSSVINNAELEKINNTSTKELEALEEQKEKKLISEKDYNLSREQIEKQTAKEIAEVRRKQAIQDRVQAAFNIGINTAQAVAAVLSTGGGTRYADFGVSAGLLTALVLAQGAAQLAAVFAKPLPEIPAFAKGGKINGKEQIIRVNEKGEEFIANDIATKRHTEELEAMNKGGKHYERLIYKRYIAPAMKANQTSTYKEKSFRFDDSGLIHKLGKVELGPRTIKALQPSMPDNYKRRTPNG